MPSPLAFLVQSPEVINHYAAVWEKLGNDRFDVVISHVNDFNESEARAKLERLGITPRRTDEIINRGERYPYLVSNHPYSSRGELLAPRLGDRQIRFMYSLGKAGWNFSNLNEHYHLFLCYGPYQAEQLARFDGRCISIGYPRFDPFFTTPIDRNTALSSLGCDPSKATVLWLPTWTDISSVDLYGKAVSALCSQYNVLIKLHPLMIENQPERVERLRTLHFDHLITDSTDNVPLFQLADYVLADYGGSAFGAIYTDRNVLFLNMPGAETDTTLGTESPDIQLRKVIVSVNPEEGSLIPPLLANDALWVEQKEIRKKLRKLFFAEYYGYSADIAAMHLNHLDEIFRYD